jgi:hypothetical protein
MTVDDHHYGTSPHSDTPTVPEALSAATSAERRVGLW